MSFFYREIEPVVELFLKACVPEIEKLMPDVGECCRGCMEGLGNQLGHACLSDADSFDRLFMEDEQMKRATILLQSKFTEILKQIRELILMEKPRYDSITTGQLLNFFCGEADSTPPLARLVWDRDWQRLCCNLIKVPPERRYIDDTSEVQGDPSDNEDYPATLSQQKTVPISLFD